ncbi:MAG: HIRAN domain-containing protein, partial [Hyphomonadaceae bacterium]|nr:HIRAN domain-containing protein [Hyphomonadaceae bacterium]
GRLTGRGNTAIVEAVLVLEDDNPHDDQAVAVTIDGALCGYLSRADARRHRADLAAAGASDARVRCKARITGGFATSGGGRAHFGLKLDLPGFGA